MCGVISGMDPLVGSGVIRGDGERDERAETPERARARQRYSGPASGGLQVETDRRTQRCTEKQKCYGIDNTHTFSLSPNNIIHVAHTVCPKSPPSPSAFLRHTQHPISTFCTRPPSLHSSLSPLSIHLHPFSTTRPAHTTGSTAPLPPPIAASFRWPVPRRLLPARVRAQCPDHTSAITLSVHPHILSVLHPILLLSRAFHAPDASPPRSFPPSATHKPRAGIAPAVPKDPHTSARALMAHGWDTVVPVSGNMYAVRVGRGPGNTIVLTPCSFLIYRTSLCCALQSLRHTHPPPPTTRPRSRNLRARGVPPSLSVRQVLDKAPKRSERHPAQPPATPAQASTPSAHPRSPLTPPTQQLLSLVAAAASNYCLLDITGYLPPHLPAPATPPSRHANPSDDLAVSNTTRLPAPRSYTVNV